MTALNIATPAETSRQLSRARLALGSFIVTLVYLWILFFLFCVMPWAMAMFGLDSPRWALPNTDYFWPNFFVEVVRFSNAHAMILTPAFICVAIWNGWAISQPSAKLRKKACLTVILSILFSGGLLVLTAHGVLDAVAAPEPVVAETFIFPSGEVLTNESQTNDDYSENHLYYQPSPFASRQSLGEVDLEESPISLRESKPLILRDGRRVAIVIDSHVFEPWGRNGIPYWGEMTTKPDAVVRNFLLTFLQPGDPSFNYLIPLDVEGYFNKSVMNYVFDHLDLAQNVLVTRRESPKSAKPRTRAERAAQRRAASKSPDSALPEFLVYSSPQYGFPLAFDLERTLAANNLPRPDTLPLKKN